MVVAIKGAESVQYWEYDITHFLLSIEYLLLLIVAVIVFFRVGRKTLGPWQIGFFVLFIIGCFCRGVYFFIQPFIMESVIDLNNQINFLLNNIPSLFFFTSYSVMLYILANIYHCPKVMDTNQANRKRKILFTLFWVINICQYAIMITLYILDFIIYDPQTKEYSNATNFIEEFVSLTMAFIYLYTSFGFFFYGFHIYREFKKVILVDNSKHTNGIKFRLKVMLGIVPLCFFLRALIMIYGIFGTLSYHWWFDITYYTLLEILPLSLVLRISTRIIQSSQIVISPQHVNNEFGYNSVANFAQSY